MTNATSSNLPPRLTGPVPGRLSRALTRRLAGVESRNITYRARDFPIFWRKASGSNVWDPDGNRYVSWQPAHRSRDPKATDSPDAWTRRRSPAGIQAAVVGGSRQVVSDT